MRRGFSLLEVLLATFILSIGLIMVLSVFPVGANWTRESTESSVAQSIALNAVAVIESHYSPESLDASHRNLLAGLTSATLTGLPGFTGNNGIPISERCYQFGNTLPFPAKDPRGCNYYWTAVGRPSPGSGGTSHEVYIFVFRKGDASQTFSQTPLAGTADTSTPTPDTFPTGYNLKMQPVLVSQAYSPGTSAIQSRPALNAVPPIGSIGVGETSGTVFRQVLDFTKNPPLGTPHPSLIGNPPTENVIYAPAADGTSGSPLIYVYQTTLPF